MSVHMVEMENKIFFALNYDQFFGPQTVKSNFVYLFSVSSHVLLIYWICLCVSVRVYVCELVFVCILRSIKRLLNLLLLQYNNGLVPVFFDCSLDSRYMQQTMKQWQSVRSIWTTPIHPLTDKPTNRPIDLTYEPNLSLGSFFFVHQILLSSGQKISVVPYMIYTKIN